MQGRLQAGRESAAVWCIRAMQSSPRAPAAHGSAGCAPPRYWHQAQLLVDHGDAQALGHCGEIVNRSAVQQDLAPIRLQSAAQDTRWTCRRRSPQARGLRRATPRIHAPQGMIAERLRSPTSGAEVVPSPLQSWASFWVASSGGASDTEAHSASTKAQGGVGGGSRAASPAYPIRSHRPPEPLRSIPSVRRRYHSRCERRGSWAAAVAQRAARFGRLSRGMTSLPAS